MDTPATYLSKSGGFFRIIHKEMPVSANKATAAEALQAAARFNLKLSPHVWNGDIGEFEENALRNA